MALENTAVLPDNVLRGIGLMAASVFGMAFTDAIVKLVSADMSVWQIFALRAAFALPVLLIIALFSRIRFKFQHLGWSLIRNAFLVLCWLSIYASLPVLDFSIVSVVIYTAPVMVILLSAFFLGEPISLRQWLGVLLGFAGVLVILRPGTEAFSWFTLLPLAGAALYALAMVTTRGKCRGEEALVLTITLQIMFGLLGLGASFVLSAVGFDEAVMQAYPFILQGWHELSFYHYEILGLIGVLSALVFAGVARAYQIAPPAILAAFDYTYLVSAVIWAFVFFGEVPDAFTIVGVLLIVGAGALAAAPPRKPKVATIAPDNIQPQ